MWIKSLSNRKILFGLGLLLGFGLFAWIYLDWVNAKPTYAGILIDPPYQAGDFTLQSDRGDVHLSDYRGKVVLLYFGYTFCPDVCPITLSKVSHAFQLLGKDSDKLQMIFISVDPDRDTPEKLGKYARAFNPAFIGATGSPDNIAAIAKKYGIFYQKRIVNSAAGYLVDHTAIVWVVDPNGNLRLEWPYGFESSTMVSDLRTLLRQK